MIEWIAIGLALLNVFQLLFWGFQVQRLVDKLMSRNYYDYQVAKSIRPEKAEPVKVPDFGPMDDLRTINEVTPF